MESVASCYPLLAVKACFRRAAKRWLPIFVTTLRRHLLWAPQIVRSKRDTERQQRNGPESDFGELRVSPVAKH